MSNSLTNSIQLIYPFGRGTSDHDTSAWVVSLLFHLLVLLTVTLLFVPSGPPPADLAIVISHEEEEPIEKPQDFRFHPQPQEHIGVGNESETETALSQAPHIVEQPIVPNPQLYIESNVGTVALMEEIERATGEHFNETLTMTGAAGVGTTNTRGAIDRLTHEILLQLQENKVLVVWLFDQSGSLQQQREEIVARFDRVYEELGVISESDHPTTKYHWKKPLLTSIIVFGREVQPFPKPTDDIEMLKEIVASIEVDVSGEERVFTAIHQAAQKYLPYRRIDRKTGKPLRKVMMIAVTDEAGTDGEMLEPAIGLCRRWAIPVHVVGVPAPFGRRETLVKYVDPDPNFDQTPQWGRVDQGPESFMLERLKLHFSESRQDAAPIDSGFGPFALTRLCFETGGVYFAVHPNRQARHTVSEAETAVASAYLRHFYDSSVMRKYRPDYISPNEYKRRLAANKSRETLVQAAKMSWIQPMENPQTRFPKRDEADLANRLLEAQKQAAKLTPKVNLLCTILEQGETDRETETSPRWRAGYDLALGRVLAVKVRTETYNAMLAKAKQGMKFKDSKNDTWILKPSDEISVGSQLRKIGERAKVYLEQVVRDHTNTPWATLASNELKTPMGWKWYEQFTGVNQAQQSFPGGNNPPPPSNDKRRMLPKPKPKRAPPPL